MSASTFYRYHSSNRLPRVLLFSLLLPCSLTATDAVVAPPTIDRKEREEIVVLEAVEYSAPEDLGYVSTDTLAGQRIRTDLLDASIYISVVRNQNLEDLAQATQEGVLAYVVEPQQNPALARVSTNSGLLDSLPIATVVDPATVEQLYSQTNQSFLTSITQRRANNRNTDKLVLRFGDEGYLAGTVESAFQPGGKGSSPALAIVSWQQFQQAQWSIFLDARHDVGDHLFRGNIQTRSLAGYGDMQLVRTSYDRNGNNRFWLQATVAWHRLRRTNPRQFQFGSPSAQFDNLGFLNLDLLTANTRELEDQIASLGLGWEQLPSPLRNKLSVQSIWHRQKADWVDAPAATRTNVPTKFTWQVRNPNNSFSSELNFELVHHAEPGLTEPSQWTHDASFGLNLQINDPVRLFINLGRYESLPFVPTGLMRNATSAPHRVSQPVEQRAIRQAGLNLNFLHVNLTGNVALFHETIRNHLFRDWAWERDHAATGAVVLPGNLLRLPVSYATAPEWQRAGWLGEIRWTPIKALNFRATWYGDWKNTGPYRGGNRQASLEAKYTIPGGHLQGFTGGFAVSTRNTMTFNDGYKLHGGLRWDLLLGYEHKLSSGHRQKFQLNLMNLTGSPWQPTRFAKDHGRQILLSVSQEF